MPKSVILVIDDEFDIRQSIADLLSWDDYLVSTAENGMKGIQMAMEIQPSLILCDVMMPDLSGYDVLQALRSYQLTSTTPFIFLTALSDRDNTRKGMKLGADDYLTKPFKHSDLLAIVKARLERAQEIQNQYQYTLDMARRSFTQMVAHELRTPLISIVMVQELIAKKIGHLKPDQLADLMGTMESGTRRLRHLVEQIVFLNQLESRLLNEKNIKEDGILVPASKLLREVLDVAKLFTQRGANIEIDLTLLEGNYYIKCDFAALKHALAELVSNALNFSPKKETVKITQWEQGGWVWIKIVDRGQGIPHEKIKQAQEDFQQINREKQEQQGLGLGLPLADRMIRIHGGLLHLNSREGKGTEVLVQLPIVR